MEQNLESSAWNMVSEVELIYKSKVKASDRSFIKSSVDMINALRNFYDENTIELQEAFYMMYLNRGFRGITTRRSSYLPTVTTITSG
ncbi:MAG: hypothetical protein J0I84_20335 [Terrimonas sp.]|nr:hypothetical protein [Terrimonas sp.]OJY84628.1 MAG: hypothetical protein BGP13_21820 [Sphingobacteriales bacterium 40-81]